MKVTRSNLEASASCPVHSTTHANCMACSIASKVNVALQGGLEMPIGYLHVLPGERGYRLIGLCCANRVGETRSPVYLENVAPYRATCCRCGKVLHKGTNVELFDGS